MPRRRRLLLATSNERKVEELARSLTKYDVEVERIAPDTILDGATIRQALQGAGPDHWVKAVLCEQMRLYPVPHSGETPAEPIIIVGPDHDALPVVAVSRLEVWQLPASDQKMIRESKDFATCMALHTHPSTHLGSPPWTPSEEDVVGVELKSKTYEHSLEGYIDMSRRDPARLGVLGWDDVFVLKGVDLTFAELQRQGGRKVSPRDQVINAYIIEHLWYRSRRNTNFIHGTLAPFDETVSFREECSVGTFVAKEAHLNNPHALKSGLQRVFVAVANQGAFFRAAQTRREVNYWLPGLNAGIPFVAKKDPIHEITFQAHDFGHFFIPDLVYTGGLSRNCRRVYILYRMMSEAITLVFADMLFVESLRRSGYEYDWSKRQIHPLFVATGQNPFETGSREAFLDCFRTLLVANVAYCLKGDSSKYLELIRANATLDSEPDDQGSFTASRALDKFKEKYMPFFVEDYKWTSANYDQMQKRPETYRSWWKMVEPLVAASGVGGVSKSGIGLETVEQFMDAIGVKGDDSLSSDVLIERIFQHVFDTRVEPIFKGPCGDTEKGELTLASPNARRTQSFVRYMMGQCFVFTLYAWVPETSFYADKIISSLCQKLTVDPKEAITEQVTTAVRGLYCQYLRILVDRGLLTSDDAANYAQICPLFDPVFVFYDESKGFYDQLDEVHRKILGGHEEDGDQQACRRASMVRTLACGLPALDQAAWWHSIEALPLAAKLRGLLEGAGVRFYDEDGARVLVRSPAVALVAVGGLPVRASPRAGEFLELLLDDRVIQVSKSRLAAALRSQMGMTAMYTYLNPKGIPPDSMWRVVSGCGHFSVGHTAQLSFLIAGHSCAVENELNCQRDVVHLGRLTVARTMAQKDPPLVVQRPELVPLFEQLRRSSQAAIAEQSARRPKAGPDAVSIGDWQEALFTAWPAAKAQVAILTGSLRNLQKLFSAIDDDGKETEFRFLLWQLCAACHCLLPDMFVAPAEHFKWRPPKHLVQD